jgi:hypothetical protein
MKNEPVFSKDRNRLKNQSRLPISSFIVFLSPFRDVLVLVTFLSLAAKMPCLADGFADVTEDSWLRTGLFCFRTGNGTNDQIHLARYENGKFDELFIKAIGRPVKPPICLTNGVIVVSVDGVIRRLNLKGEYIFEAKPKGFEGLAGHIGSRDDHHIFMVGSVFDEKANIFKHRLYVVDISGSEPVLKTTFDIIEPYQIALTLDEIIVVGETNVQRLAAPPDRVLKEPK